MDGVIDPPSLRSQADGGASRRKAKVEAGFLAMQDDRIVGCIFAAEHYMAFLRRQAGGGATAFRQKLDGN